MTFRYRVLISYSAHFWFGSFLIRRRRRRRPRRRPSQCQRQRRRRRRHRHRPVSNSAHCAQLERSALIEAVELVPGRGLKAKNVLVDPQKRLRSARNFARMRFGWVWTFGFSTWKKHFQRKNWIRNFIFRWFGMVLDGHGRTNLKISFLVKFCPRWTYPEVCNGWIMKISNRIDL